MADDWRDAAACLGKPTEWWYDGDYDQARPICAACPVRGECLQYAVTNREPDGMFGGLTFHQRGKIRRGALQVECAECGQSFTASRAGRPGRRTAASDPQRRWCSHACQQRDWYRRNRDEVTAGRRARRAEARVAS